MRMKFNHLFRKASHTRLLEVALDIAISSIVCAAQSSVEFDRTLSISNEQPVRLSVELDHADLQILYDRDSEVSIHGVALAAGDAKLDENYFASTFAIEQTGNAINVRLRPEQTHPQDKLKLRFRLNVPYRTEVHTTLGEGSQTMRGLLGPLDIQSHKGNISASYISKEVHAEIGHGNLDIQVIGEPVVAKVGVGNICGLRLEKGIDAQINEGDISLVVVGSSSALVATGNGRIDVSGARGTLTLSTDAGDLGVRAVPHSDWKLNSTSGAIYLDLPPTLNAELKASTDSGDLQVERDDILKDEKTPNSLDKRFGGGGQLIAAHTETGKIVIR